MSTTKLWLAGATLLHMTMSGAESLDVDRRLLSVCIPTHGGRARVLDRALRSVGHQLTDTLAERVQVVVSDNGSEDETSTVIAEHASRLGGALVHHRFEDNGGFTRNLLKVVEMADGEFCWFLGSDDEIEPGGISAVLGILHRHPEVTGITVSRLNVDDSTPDNVIADHPSILPPSGRPALYVSADTIFADLGMLQDYMSTQIVSRQGWLDAVAALGAEGVARGLAFPHLPILGHMIRQRPIWYWHAQPLIRHRIGVRAVDVSVGRDLGEYLITVTRQRASIWSAMFGRRSALYRTVMRRSYAVQANPFALAHCKQQEGQTLTGDVRLLGALTRYYGFLPEFWLRSFPVLLLPWFTIPTVSRLSQWLRRQRDT